VRRARKKKAKEEEGGRSKKGSGGVGDLRRGRKQQGQKRRQGNWSLKSFIRE